jgi:hypothetical protein
LRQYDKEAIELSLSIADLQSEKIGKEREEEICKAVTRARSSHVWA